MRTNRAKKAIAGIVSLCLLGASMGVLPGMSAAAAALGDVNEDAAVSIADAVALQKALVGVTKLSPAGAANADLTADGKVNVFDLVLLKRQLVQQPAASDAITIHLSSNGISVDGDTKGAVQIEGSVATITASGSYVVDGTMEDGQVLVNVPAADTETVDLTLKSVTMTNSSKPCIYVQSADKVKLTLTGTTTLTDTAAAAYATPGCIYAACDLTVTKSSTGSLDITSSMNAGIYCKDDLKLNGGTISVNTNVDDLSDADAIRANNTLTLGGATVTVDASADGVKSSKENVVMEGGNVSIKAGNDAVQATTSIDISGGTIVAGGDRGFRLDNGGTLNITGGEVLATATDYQITDSTASGAAINMSGSTQQIVLLDYTEQQKKNQAIQFFEDDSDTTCVYAQNPTKKFQYVLASGSDIAKETVLYTGGGKCIHSGNYTFNLSGNPSAFVNVEIISAVSDDPIQGTPASDSVATAIQYSGSTVKILNAAGETLSKADNASVSGSEVTISQPSELSVTGDSTSARIIVDVDKTTYPDGQVTLNLEGTNLSNSTAAPIYVKAIGNEAVISAKNGTTNTISDGTSHTDTASDGDAIGAAIYAEDDLKLKGKGALTVNGNTADGISCKNDVKLWNGSLTVNAVDDGIRGKDSVKIGDPDATDYSTLNITVTTKSGDGIKSTNSTDANNGCVVMNGGTVNITAYSDGIQGEQWVTINGGDLNIKTTATVTSSGGSTGGWGGMGGMGGMDGNTSSTDVSSKGIKAVGIYDAAGTTYQSGGDLSINGGNITIDSADDSLHCGGDMYLYGGKLHLKSGDDAAHSDHNLNIGNASAETFDDVIIHVTACYEGIEGQNITQKSGSVYINSTDDGYNAAGGADGSGNTSPGGWGGGRPGMGGTTSGGGSYAINISGGLVYIVTASGDHDGVDSNGSINITGGYVISNGNESIDADGTISINGGVVAELIPSGSMGGNGSISLSSISADTRITLTSNNTVLVSFPAGKTVSSMNVKGSASSASVSTGGTVSGGTAFPTDCASTPSIVRGGTLSGGTAAGSGSGSSGSTNPWGGR